MTTFPSTRRSRAYISFFGTTMLHLKNPWVVVFWSFAFPGCGTLVQGRLGKGLILVCWELFVNTNAKVNLAILYSLIGQFDKAKEVVDTRWFLIYIALYVYSMWDCYKGTIDSNKQYILADREDGPVGPVVLKTMDTNFLDRRVPWLASTLSMLSPGLGHLYVHKVTTGLFFMGWTVLVMVMSQALPAVHYTLVGEFDKARAIVDMQWLMYLPSIYGFVFHDSYVSAVEYNKLFKKVQSRFLRDNYQQPDFHMPV